MNTPFAAQIAAVAALLPPARIDQLDAAVIDFGCTYQHERGWGYKPGFMRLPAIPELSHAESRELLDRLNARYYRGTIDREEGRACAAAIDAAWRVTRTFKKSLNGGALRTYLRERDGDDCWLCHEPMGEDRTIEHKHAKANGGTGNIANLALAHGACNRAVGHAGLAVKEAIRAARLSEKLP